MRESQINGENPILFNAIKHHKEHILEFISNAKSLKFSEEKIRKSLLRVGRLMIDVYYGDLTVQEIEFEIALILKKLNAFDKQRYDAFIESKNKKYKTVTLSDGSNWTLLKGRQEGKHIHIHPSRYSKHTTRVKATSLKTAIYLHIYYSKPFPDEQLVALTNEVRKKYLEESPIKNEVYTTGLKRVLKLL